MLILIVALSSFVLASGLLRRGLPVLFFSLSFSMALLVLAFDFAELRVVLLRFPDWSKLVSTMLFGLSVGCALRVVFLTSEMIGSWAGDVVFGASLTGNGQEIDARRFHSPNFSSASSQALRWILFLYAMCFLTERSNWILALALNIKKSALLMVSEERALEYVSAIPLFVSLSFHMALLLLLPSLLVAVAIDFFLAVLYRIVPYLAASDFAICIKGLLVLLALSYAYYYASESMGGLLDAVALRLTAWGAHG